MQQSWVTCPECEGLYNGVKCRCGYTAPTKPAAPVGQRHVHMEYRRRCSWQYSDGSTCGELAVYDCGDDGRDEDLLCAGHFSYKRDPSRRNDQSFIFEANRRRERSLNVCRYGELNLDGMYVVDV